MTIVMDVLFNMYLVKICKIMQCKICGVSCMHLKKQLCKEVCIYSILLPCTISQCCLSKDTYVIRVFFHHQWTIKACMCIMICISNCSLTFVSTLMHVHFKGTGDDRMINMKKATIHLIHMVNNLTHHTEKSAIYDIRNQKKEFAQPFYIINDL